MATKLVVNQTSLPAQNVPVSQHILPLSLSTPLLSPAVRYQFCCTEGLISLALCNQQLPWDPYGQKHL